MHSTTHSQPAVLPAIQNKTNIFYKLPRQQCSRRPALHRRYNDIPLVCDKEIEQKLLDSKVDKEMAQHISHLFIRDSISLFSERIHQDDVREMDHFEVRGGTHLHTSKFNLTEIYT